MPVARLKGSITVVGWWYFGQRIRVYISKQRLSAASRVAEVEYVFIQILDGAQIKLYDGK